MWLTLTHHWVRYQLIFKVLFFAVLGLGIYLGMHPSPPPTSASWHGPFYHAGGLFACTILSVLTYPRWRWWVRGLLMFAVGVMIEYVQSYHPTRSADFGDILVNSVGVAAGLVCIYAFNWWRESRLDLCAE